MVLRTVGYHMPCKSTVEPIEIQNQDKTSQQLHRVNANVRLETFLDSAVLTPCTKLMSDIEEIIELTESDRLRRGLSTSALVSEAKFSVIDQKRHCNYQISFIQCVPIPSSFPIFEDMQDRHLRANIPECWFGCKCDIDRRDVLGYPATGSPWF